MSPQPAPTLGPIKPRRILVLIIFLLSFGTVFYHYVENLNWLDSIYFCVITLTTVGYGDITPHTNPGKIFTIFYVLIGVGIIASSVAYLVRWAAEKRIDTIIKK
jgi:voltage-gated potassium channel